MRLKLEERNIQEKHLAMIQIKLGILINVIYFATLFAIHIAETRSESTSSGSNFTSTEQAESIIPET
jgi:hypothetical protein